MLSVLMALSFGCNSHLATSPTTNKPKVVKKAKKPPPKAIQEVLSGGPYPGLLLSQVWFWTDQDGNPQPGPARLDIWRKEPDGWKKTRLEDGESNVFHKAIPYEGGILTIGAEQAKLKKWMMKDGKWSFELLWTKKWGGKFNRLRDIEIGDVDGDNKDELVIATHDYGVIAVIHPDEKYRVEELDQKADTFVHEIEIGDIDGDGKLEFFATPSDRNKASHSQGGTIVQYKWDGETFKRTIVESFAKTHAKEILAADLNKDGKVELLAVLEAEAIGKTIIKPVEIRQYIPQKDGSFSSIPLITIQDKQLRFLVPGDFDGDGQMELVAAAMTSGIWLIDQQKDGKWSSTLIDKESSSFEHSCYGADLDKDGKLELYVAADNQKALNQYKWNATKKQFDKTKIGSISGSTMTWNITSGVF